VDGAYPENMISMVVHHALEEDIKQTKSFNGKISNNMFLFNL